MKQITVALDGLNFSACAVKYAALLASSAKTNLTGIFLDDVVNHNYSIYDLLDDEGVSENKFKALNEKEDEKRKGSVKEFEKICRQANVKCLVRHDRNVALQELLKESIYTDLIILDRKETFFQSGKKNPSAFLKGFLADSECPVFIVPASFRAFDKLIFLYDGSPTSVRAVKAFGYLLNTFCHLPLEVVTVKQSADYPDLSGKYLMREWIKKYFAHAVYTTLSGDSESTIVKYVKTQKNDTLFILGARHRGTLSYWFRESMADVLIQKVQAPLFVVRY